jgi:hypothetical protein
MSEHHAPALQVEPMNDQPIQYPLVSLSALSEDALHMYKHGGGRSLNRDVFDHKTRNRYITPVEERTFQPTDRMMEAIRELEAVNLATYSSKYGHSLSVTRIHEHYTVAFGRGSQLIRVSTFEDYPDESELLAVLVGSDLEHRDSGPIRTGEMVVRSRHEDATDFEHDASSTAQLTVRFTGSPTFSGYGGMEFYGVLSSANLYSLGTDPVKQSDEDTKYDGELCDTCETPHPFAPFLPPTATWLKGPTFVKIEVLPLRPYTVADPSASH